MIQGTENTLHFLGQRNYLQGGTLFELLMTDFADATDITVKIRRPLLTDRVRVNARTQMDPRNVAALFECRSPRVGQVSLAVQALVPSPEPKREAFDERRVVDRAHFTDSAVLLSEPSPFRLITTLTALNKALLLRLLRPPEKGQWLFTRLDISRYPESFGRLMVRFRARSGFSAVASDITIDDSLLGQIVFSWGEPA
jgi:hypothetical protein